MVNVDPKGIIQGYKVLDYYEDKPDAFVFDKCKSLEGNSRMWLPTPHDPYIKDQITIFFEALPGSKVYSYKKRQIQWTWTHVKCIVACMLLRDDYTSYWHSITEGHSKDVIKRARGILTNLDFELAPSLMDIYSTVWEIKDFGNTFEAFTKNPHNITGKYPNHYTLDEVTKYDPQSLYEEIKDEAIAATKTGVLFINSTSKHGNTFEDTIRARPLVGPSYEEHLKSFPIPSKEEWLKERRKVA